MAAPKPPANAPTAPRDFKPPSPPQTGRICRLCSRPLDGNDRELCKHCQGQKAKPFVPIPSWNNEWGPYVGEDGEENIFLREALEHQRRNLPNASQLEIAQALERRWDFVINRSMETNLAKPAEEVEQLPRIVGRIAQLRRLIEALEQDDPERKEREYDELVDFLNKEKK